MYESLLTTVENSQLEVFLNKVAGNDKINSREPVTLAYKVI